MHICITQLLLYAVLHHFPATYFKTSCRMTSEFEIQLDVRQVME